jgi:hypothetical protein
MERLNKGLPYLFLGLILSITAQVVLHWQPHVSYLLTILFYPRVFYLPFQSVGRGDGLPTGPLNTFLLDVGVLSIGTLYILPFAGNHYIPSLTGLDSHAF